MEIINDDHGIHKDLNAIANGQSTDSIVKEANRTYRELVERFGGSVEKDIWSKSSLHHWRKSGGKENPPPKTLHAASWKKVILFALVTQASRKDLERLLSYLPYGFWTVENLWEHACKEENAAISDALKKILQHWWSPPEAEPSEGVGRTKQKRPFMWRTRNRVTLIVLFAGTLIAGSIGTAEAVVDPAHINFRSSSDEKENQSRNISIHKEPYGDVTVEVEACGIGDYQECEDLPTEEGYGTLTTEGELSRIELPDFSISIPENDILLVIIVNEGDKPVNVRDFAVVIILPHYSGVCKIGLNSGEYYFIEALGKYIIEPESEVPPDHHYMCDEDTMHEYTAWNPPGILQNKISLVGILDDGSQDEFIYKQFILDTSD
ncbi:MAG: hypothetical protein DHS20C20_05340 [Ardenticatenaceae bacterium]|nr:MAG: hypothetical protein DHS20C20_05340 [Ardenticatenaceae bacterium]